MVELYYVWKMATRANEYFRSIQIWTDLRRTCIDIAFSATHKPSELD